MRFRDYKTFRLGNVYHIFNRGNNKENIFNDENDYLNFLKRLKLVTGTASSSILNIKALPTASFTFFSYCLMPNHFHFLIRQNSETGINDLMLKLTTSYSMYFNKKHSRLGPLFQDTFKAKLIDSDNYLKYLSAYIHNNPANPLNYPYSSFLDIIGERNGTICDKEALLGLFNGNSQDYKKFVLGFKASDKQKINAFLFEDEQE